MRVLITGGNGQLGGALQRTAPAHFDVNAINSEDCDLTDSAMLRARLVVEAPDVIINAAAFTAGDRAESEEALAAEINSNAVAVMVEALQEHGGRMAHISTDFVFDGESVRAYLPEGEEIDAIALDDRATGLQLQVTAFVCDPAGICGNFGDTLQVFREGEGQYLVQMPGGERRRMWVIWADEGFRTAVVGNPEGTFAWILDRQAKGGADRIRAAREILEFNGYDPRQLKEAS